MTRGEARAANAARAPHHAPSFRDACQSTQTQNLAVFCVPREAVHSGQPLAFDVIPAQAGIQYSRGLVIGTEALEYWIARLRGR
ncbi:hypothetical protein DY467_24935 [Rhodopseudomonas sp. BR0G17]|nr:hypothetical protein [Rhodopseudomonas sp. BR0G17]